MRLIAFLVLRAWRGNPLRTLLSVLGIALGVAIVTAIHVMDHNTIESRLRQAASGSGRVDFELLPKEPDREPEQVTAELRAGSGVAAVGVVHRAPIVVSRDGGTAMPAMLFGLAPLPDREFSHYALTAGDDLSELAGERAVLIGPTLAEELAVAPGDELLLGPSAVAPRGPCRDGERQASPSGPGDLEPLRVRVRGLIAARFLGDREGGRSLIGSYALAERLAPRETTVYQIKRSSGADLERIRRQFEPGYLVRDERSALLGESSDERAFRNGVKLLGGLALMLGMFVVFQTLSQSLVERLRHIGLLRCLGSSSTTVVGVFLVDALALAVVGIGLGLVLGLLLAWLLQQFDISTLGMLRKWRFHEIPMRPLLWTAGLALLFTLSGSAFPLWRARSIPTLRILHARGLGGQADVMRGVQVFLFLMLVLVLPIGYLAMTTLLSETERETQAVLLQLGGLLLAFGALLLLAPQVVRCIGRVLLWPFGFLAPLPVQLVRKSLLRQTGRVAASVCGLGVVLLAGIALESLTSALHGDARRMGALAMDDRIFVGGDLDTAAAQALGGLDGVRHADVLIGPVFPGLQLSAAEPAMLARPGAPLAGRPDALARFADTRSLIVSERLARLQDLEPGSAVALRSDAGPVAYTVLAVGDGAGFFPDEPAYAITHPRWMKQDFCMTAEPRVGRLILQLEPGTPSGGVIDAVRQALPGLQLVKRGQDIVSYLIRDVTRDFRLFQILLLLVLVLAAIGVVNSMTIAALGRVREIGVLRALGTSRGQLMGSFIVEGALTGTLAALVALALGIPLGRLVVDGMNEVAGLSAPYVVPWRAIIAVPVVAIAIGVLAAIVPGRRAGRLDPAEAVRFE